MECSLCGNECENVSHMLWECSAFSSIILELAFNFFFLLNIYICCKTLYSSIHK